MFTGIITTIGRITQLQRAQHEARIDIGCDFTDYSLGESIAVNGVCLTVTKHSTDGFSALASEETLARSTLGQLAVGTRVNLERAVRLSDRLGGHLVTGHVDAVGFVAAKSRVTQAERWQFRAPGAVLRMVAEKGSIAINGVSLTVNSVTDSQFAVMLVPFTLSGTTFGELSINDPVNLEIDPIARYVSRMLDGRSEATASAESRVSEDLLTRAGFIKAR
jgi:riboflavin synthase